MASEKIDFAEVLAVLEAKRAALDTLIGSYKAALVHRGARPGWPLWHAALWHASPVQFASADFKVAHYPDFDRSRFHR